MKKAISAGFITVLIFAGLAYAQKDSVQAETPKAKAQIEEMLATAERNMREPYKLNDAIHALRRRIPNRDVGAETRREATKRLVKIFYSIDDSLANPANKERILEIVGFFDNSPEAHEFFLKVLSSGNAKHRKMALRTISPHGVHGDDLYAKIKSLEREGVLSHVGSLLNLARANPARAVEEMKSFLKTTQNLKEFVVIGLDLPEGYYDDPDVLDIIVDRYAEFKAKPIPHEYEGYTPEGAIASEYLWKYIDVREGEKLKKAMRIMQAKGVSYSKDLPLLAKKIKSNNPVTREAIVDFLDSQVISGNLKKETVVPILEEAKNSEHDQRVKLKLEGILGKHKKEAGK